MQRENQERRLRSSMASLSLQEEISFSQLATPASCNRSSTLQNANNGRQPPNNNEGHEQPLQNSNTNSKNNKNLLSNRWQRSNLQQPPENIDSIRRANNRWQRSSLQPPENVNNNHNNIQRQNNHIQQPPESSSNSIPTANNPTAQALIELCGFEYGDRRKYAERAVPVEYMTHDTYKSRAEEIAQDGLLRAGQADSQKFDKDLAGPGAPPVTWSLKCLQICNFWCPLLESGNLGIDHHIISLIIIIIHYYISLYHHSSLSRNFMLFALCPTGPTQGCLHASLQRWL